MGHHAASYESVVGAVHRHNRLGNILYHELARPAISLTVFQERVFRG